jgi:hypothetical protein
MPSIHVPPLPGDADNFEDELVPNNIVGAYRVMEAARKAGVKKLLLASSGQVIVGHRKAGQIPVRAEAPYAPRYLYACTKVFLEQLGQVYAAHHGMKVIAVRLGWCPRNPGQIAELTANPDDQDVYLSPADAGRFFACAVDAALDRLPPFAPVYVTRRSLARERYDLGPRATSSAMSLRTAGPPAPARFEPDRTDATATTAREEYRRPAYRRQVLWAEAVAVSCERASGCAWLSVRIRG